MSAEAEQALTNIGNILAAAGGGLSPLFSLFSCFLLIISFSFLRLGCIFPFLQTTVNIVFALRFLYPARARSARARRACALRALGLLLADGTPTGGRGEDFLSRRPDFFTETAVTSERKVEKSFPRWEINRHIEG